MLSYYRSQHSDQSWLAAMAVVMDTCALRMAGAGGFDEFQSERTLAMCISALRNINEILQVRPLERYKDRLSPSAFHTLTEQLRRSGSPKARATFGDGYQKYGTPMNLCCRQWQTIS
jgi:hypothetical protein